LWLADLNHWTRFATMQDHYNLLYREEEREMLPLCRDQGVGVTPWSPLARGRLTRPWDDATERSTTDDTALRRYQDPSIRQIVEAVAGVAEQRGIPRAHVALAWLLSRPGVTAPIVGATKPHHLDDAVAALDVQLSSDEIAALETPYRPQAIAGH
jgi:aryl-alcohol dehydrogenase-like predicted oxidoreductase